MSAYDASTAPVTLPRFLTPRRRALLRLALGVLLLCAASERVARGLDFEDDSVALRALAARLSPATVAVHVATRSESSTGVEIDREAQSMGIVVKPGVVRVPSSLIASDGVFPARLLSADVVVAGGRTFTARHAGTDEASGSAFLRVDDPAFSATPLQLAIDDALEVGDFVASVRLAGPSFRHAPYLEAFLVSGALDEPVRCYLTSFAVSDYLGCAVASLDGRVVGVIGTTRLGAGPQKDAVTGAALRSMFAPVFGEDPGGEEITIVPASRLREAIARAPDESAPEAARQSFLGLETQALFPELRAALGLAPDAAGVLVTRVLPGSPAAAAGFLPGEHIVAADGVPLSMTADAAGEPSVAELRKAVLAHAPGEAMTFEIAGPAGQVTREVVLAPAPKVAAEAARARCDAFGVQMRDLVYLDRVDARIPLDQPGARITAVAPAGFLGLAGLRVGDIVSRVQDEPVADAAALAARLDALAQERSAAVRLFVLRGRSSLFVHATPDWAGAAPETAKR